MKTLVYLHVIDTCMGYCDPDDEFYYSIHMVFDDGTVEYETKKYYPGEWSGRLIEYTKDELIRLPTRDFYHKDNIAVNVTLSDNSRRV